jgi:retron-type reverse transcriptase
MKRVGNLSLLIAEPDNLRLAFLRAARGKEDRSEVMSYRRELGKNLTLLRDRLLCGDVAVGDYRFFEVRDPKIRMICAAAFSERVLHHAIMNICEPVLERYAIFDSYACRRGKGSRKAIERAQRFSRQEPWYLKLDIRKYFDSIDQRIVMELLHRRFKDPALLALFARIVASYRTAPGRGLPIGNLISQHLANFYLAPFDHWLKEELSLQRYVRYMDDFIVFGQDRETLKKRLQAITEYLDGVLHLRLKENIQLNRCSLGIPFLGYRLFPETILLQAGSRNRFAAKARLYRNLLEKGVWDEAACARHMEPLIDFTRFARSRGFRRSIFELGCHRKAPTA